MPAAKKAKYPFLFYGVDPADWFEGQDAPYHYELLFKTAPDAAARLKIARAFEEAVAESDSIGGKRRPWLWAGPWALVTVGVRAAEVEEQEEEDDDYGFDDEDDEDDHDGEDDDEDDEEMDDDAQQFLEDMAYTFRRVHEVAPLVEVVFAGAREPSRADPWEKWTTAQQAARTDGPRWGGWAKGLNLDVGAFPSQERSAAETVEDAKFEAERRRARKAAGIKEVEEDEDEEGEEADA